MMTKLRTITCWLGFIALLSVGGPIGCESDGGPDPTGDPGVCTPDCHFRQCGDNGCGGTCGECGLGMVCASFQCIAPGQTPAPVPDVTGPGTDATAEADTGPVPTGDDSDGDGLLDELDNCPSVYNPTQADLDGDYQGDACDPDIDGDDSLNDLDCAPTDPSINPYAREYCNTGIDENCNGATDEENAWDCEDYFIDTDGDGSGPSETKRCLCAPDGDHTVTVGGDCDDADPLVSPLMDEVCDNTDNDCNLLIDDGCDDDGDGYCDADMAIVGMPDICPLGPNDCYDYSADVHPGAEEIAGDGVDNDCDGMKEGDGGPINCACANSCTGTTPADFLCAIDMCCDALVINYGVASPTNDQTSGAIGAIAHYGNAANDLSPFQGASYAIMGSGFYNGSSHQDYLTGSGSASDPYSQDGYDQMYDAVEYYVTMKAPPGATGFSIDYIFMSAEYHEWVGTQFNDKFYIIIEAASTNNGQATIVNYANCSNPNSYHDAIIDGQKMCYIAINAAFSEPCPNAPTNISGTQHECAAGGSSTGWLTTKWPINGNETFKLTFHIHDTSDQAYDSQVLIDNFIWEGGEFSKGTASHN